MILSLQRLFSGLPLPKRKRTTAALPWGTESPNLDFLRANAVLLVLLFHVLAFFGIRKIGPLDLESMGMFGLLSFYVHTTFVLMLSLERQLAKFGPQSLFLLFMARRFFRVYPLSIFIVAIIVLFRLPLAGHPWSMHYFHAFGKLDIISNFLLAQNITSSEPVEGPLWSLSYEVQIYLFLPALFLIAKKVKSPWTLVIGWGLLAIPIFLLKRAGYGQVMQYVPCFLPGIVAYKFSKQVHPRRAFWGWPVLLWSLAGLFGLVGRLGMGWLICLMIGMALPQFTDLKNPAVQRASYLISKYSYGFYLSHYFCEWLSFTKLRYLPTGAQWITFLVTVTVIPILLYHALEAPMMHVGKKLTEAQRNYVRNGLLASRAA